MLLNISKNSHATQEYFPHCYGIPSRNAWRIWILQAHATTGPCAYLDNSTRNPT